MKIPKKVAIAALAAVTLALVAPMSAMAAATTTPTVGNATGQTSEAFWILDSETETPLAAGGSVSMIKDVAGSNAAVTAAISAPAGSTYYTFISPRGEERNKSAWNAFLLNGTGSANIALPPVKPSGLTSAGTGSPAGIGAVAIAGGDYSLGVAFVTGTSTVVKVDFTYITVVAGPLATTTYTYAQPAAAVAPVITTQPTSTSKVVGTTATFTAAASGTPTPTVKWQSAPSASTTWTDIAGATSDTLTVANVQAADAGKQYRAVYTNSGGSATSNAAVLTVTFAAPTEPTGTVAGGSKGNVNVANGNTTFPFTFTGVPAGTYGVWAWSTPTQLANATVDASGNVTFNIAGLTPGTHTIALVDGTNTVVAWLTITIAQPANTSVTDLTVNVTTSNKFALEGVATSVNLGSAARGASTSADLPVFTVTDDRNLLPGWDLTSTVDNFVNAAAANDVIDKSALKIEPRKVGNPVALISAKPQYTVAASNLFAEGLVNSSTASTGTQFDAKLTFTVPTTAKAGTYASKLTLTLTSK